MISGLKLGQERVLVTDIGVRNQTGDPRPDSYRADLQRVQEELRFQKELFEHQREALRNVATHTRCILWQGTAQERDGALAWNIQVIDEEAAQRVIPLVIAPGQTYAQAWSTSIRPKDRERLTNLVARVTSGASTYSDEFACMGADGRVYWLSELLHVEMLRPGLWRLFGICADVTQRRKDEQALARLSLQYEVILNAAGDGITGVDANQRISFMNPAAARMLGYEIAELHGQDLHATIHHTRADGSSYPVDQCPIYRALQDGEVHHASNEVFWRKDGNSFVVEYTCTPIREQNQIVGAVVAFHDVTERRMIDRMKDEFISVVSHELRTPLTSIRGSLGLLASGVLGSLPEQGQRMLEIAVNNTDRLVRLINDILDIERIESGKVAMEKKTCDTAELIQQAVELVQSIAQESEIRLTVSADSVQIWADPDRFVQVMTNLLSNAIKFSPPGSKVTIRAQHERNELQIQVKDQGRGIPSDKLEAIFGRFQQVDASDSREKGGTGLGLAICRSIIQQHGGRIWAESTLGSGSTFFVVLPALAEASGKESGLDRDRSAGGFPRPNAKSAGSAVLLCDDDPAILEVVKALLENRGYRVILADSGPAAIREAARHCPSVILLDLVMPGMDGWETMAILKQQPETKDIPVIIFSVLSPTGVNAERTDVADWVVKPLDETPLFRALERVLGSSGRAPRVVIVEDDLDLANVLMAMFQRHGIETIHATTGREAIRLSQEADPDLVVLDLILPNGDGFSVVNWLRQHNRLHSTPLVVYTARDLDEADRERLRLGYTLFLTKGRISPDQFEQYVVGLLNQFVPLH